MDKEQITEATLYNLQVSKISGSYGVRLPKKFAQDFGLKKADMFSATVTDFGVIEVTAKTDSTTISSNAQASFDLKVTVNGSGLIFTLGNENLVKIGWFPKQELKLVVDDNKSFTISATCGCDKEYLTPNWEKMTEDDLRASYKLLQERIDYIANQGLGIEKMDIFVVSSGVKLLDKLHMAWTRMFDERLKQEN